MTNPFRFDVARFMQPSATASTITQTGPCPSRIGNAMIAIDEGEESTVTAVISPLGGSVMVNASIDTILHGQCARCLSEIVADYSFDIDDVFLGDTSIITTSGDAIAEEDDEEIEVREIVDSTVDLEQSIVDYSVVELPFSPECADYGLECSGEADERIAGVADGDAGQAPQITDIRWAGLEKFK